MRNFAVTQRPSTHYLAHLLVGLVVVAAMLFVFGSCAGLYTAAKAAAVPATGAAAGAGVGLLFGPLGAIAGAAIGAMIAHSLAITGLFLDNKIGPGDYHPPPVEPFYAVFLQPSTWLWAAAIWFAWRNRAHLLAWWSAEGGTKLRTAVKGIAHSIVGGKVGK